MPLIQIYLVEGQSDDYLQALSDGIHEALLETWGIPVDDRFQMIHEKKLEHFMIDKKMWGVVRSDNVVLLHITSSPRSTQMKLDFYRRLPEILQQKIQLRPEDVFVSIVTNQREDWTFGLGKAQLIEQDQ